MKANRDKPIFGILRRECERQGLTAPAVAQRTGLGAMTVSDLLSGKTANPGILTVGKVLGALGKTQCWLDRKRREEL